MNMKETPIVDYQCAGAVAVIRINRPEKLNAFNRRMYLELNAAFARFNADESLRAAVVTAAGSSFSAGVDVKDVGAARALFKDRQALAGQFTLDMEDLEFTPKPVIAAIQGHCYGQGLTFALACDLRIASEDALFCLPEVKVGLASVHGTLRSVKNVGLGNALELLLMGEPRDAQWAQKSGLVNKVVKPEELEEQALAWANAIAAIDPAAIRATREVAVRSQFMSFDETVGLGVELRKTTQFNR